MGSSKPYDGCYPNDEVLEYFAASERERRLHFTIHDGAPQFEDLPGQRLTIVSRDEWGAVPPVATEPLIHPIKTAVFAYNTQVPPCNTLEECSSAMQTLQKRHMALGLSDIYYNFCIGGDGAVYEGRGWFVKPAKSQNYPKFYGISFVIGVIGDGRCDQKWKKEFEIVAPGMRLLRSGVKKDYIIDLHNVSEDHDKIVPCKLPDC